MSLLRRILQSILNIFSVLTSSRTGLFAFFRRLRNASEAHGGKMPEKPVAERPRASRADIEKLVGMPVRAMELYEQALRHRSSLSDTAGEEHTDSNERLEFLGDAVLDFVTAEHLYRHFPDGDEGFLTRLRAQIVNGRSLARFASELGLGDMIVMSDAMGREGGRDSTAILADTLEAVIAALYLDMGEQAARTFIRTRMLARLDLDDLAQVRDNYKSLLLEHVQALGWPQPHYRVAHQEGPPHERMFTIDVLLRGQAYGRGQAHSKKKAEQKAAEQAFNRLRRESRNE